MQGPEQSKLLLMPHQLHQLLPVRQVLRSTLRVLVVLLELSQLRLLIALVLLQLLSVEVLDMDRLLLSLFLAVPVRNFRVQLLLSPTELLQLLL